MADVNIRRLVENASSLEPGGGASTRRHHELGHRINKNTRYPHKYGAVYLPNRGDGLDRLRAAIKVPVLDLAPDFNGSAWRALLASESSLELPTPEADVLLAEGIAVPGGRIGDVRRFALAAVLKPGQETFTAQGSLLSSRFAGTAVLTVLVDPLKPTTSSDAWVTVEWKHSTAMLASWVARQLELAGSATVARAAQRSVAVMIHPARSHLFDETMKTRLARQAAAFGMKLRLLDRGVTDFGSVQQSLTRDMPSTLIAFGTQDANTDALVGGYRRATGRSVLYVDTADGDEALPTLRDGFAQVCGISASLHLLGEVDDALETGPGRPVPPVIKPVDCRHDGNSRYYLHDAATGLWWTVDTAGHAGSVFKTYLLVGAELVHEACRDASGKAIAKWKGTVGQTVPLKDLHGCADPARHL